MRLFLSLLFLLSGMIGFSQNPNSEDIFTKIDSLYREDQFYFGLTYNSLVKPPEGFSQNGFSVGLNAGFLRDMPVNKSRTVAIAAGFGLSYDKYHQNLVVSEVNGEKTYEIVNHNSFSNNKLEQVFVDFPLELRWRNSTPESHKFWRIYSGFKLRYLLFDKTKYEGQGVTKKIFNNSDFNEFQYGPYLSFGHNTLNLSIYYALNPIFKSAAINGVPVDMRNLNFGLMFYIL